eukprot:TRINITY_DN8212_c0_g1_i1.p1 TRINITY_DN8212_c0_g1~~TRINITY_DN8212_c0_g1_i1.p1  ORF type:complete len:312 (-),score=58.58 TRINITY_DN8212_c0_g1_i1:276-1211(-)
MTEKRLLKDGDGAASESKRVKGTTVQLGQAREVANESLSAFLELPFELFCHIRSFLSIHDRASLDTTCRTIYEYFTPEQREDAKQEWLLINELQIKDPVLRNKLKQGESEGLSYWLVSVSLSFMNDEQSVPLSLEDLCSTFYELVVEELDFWFHESRSLQLQGLLYYTSPKTPIAADRKCDHCDQKPTRMILNEGLCFRHLRERWKQGNRRFRILAFFELCEGIAMLTPHCNESILENTSLQVHFKPRTLVWVFSTIGHRMVSSYVLFQGRRRSYASDEDEEEREEPHEQKREDSQQEEKVEEDIEEGLPE